MSTKLLKLLPLLALLLLACGTTAPHIYRQGIPVAPSAPAFNPITDSPVTTGQPGYVGPVESLPRSPHGRVLPETPATRKEAGLWAGDRPQASSRAGEPKPEILDIGLPMPPNAKTNADKNTALYCAGGMDRAARRSGLHMPAMKLDPAVRECLSARLYLNCFGGLALMLEHARQAGESYDRDEYKALKSFADFAQQHAKKACLGVQQDGEFTDLLNKITSEWLQGRGD